MSEPPCSFIDLQAIIDDRGKLIIAEEDRHVPFAIKRIFAITGVGADVRRGGHAHRQLHQLLVCLHGSVSVTFDDGKQTWTVLLDDPSRGLHIPPMIWASQDYSGSDAVLLILCSDLYAEEDYIRNHKTFLAETVEGS